MSARLGVSISSNAVRGVLVRAGRVVWSGRTTIGDKERVSAALERLLADSKLARAQRARVCLALGLAHSHVKGIEGLPPVRHTKLISRIVKESPDAFFVRVGGRTVVSDVEIRSDGSTWAAALDSGLIDEALAVLRRRNLRVTRVLPFAAAVSHVVPVGTWCLADDALEVELTTIERGIIQDCRRRMPAVAGGETRPSVDALDALGTGASEFMAAYGAAVAPPRAAFTWRPAPDPARVRRFDMLRVAAASLVLIASLGGALVARGAHATLAAAAASAQLSSLHDSQIDAARTDAELRRTTAELDRIRQFDATRGRMTLLLGALSEALPDSTAVISLRVDTLDASLIVLAPNAAEILPELLDLPGVIAPRIIGSVTREALGGVRVERASIRFRRSRAVAR